MFCKKCGTELREGAKFCPKCGAAVVLTVRTDKGTVHSQPEYQPQHKTQFKKKRFWVFVIILVLVAMIAVAGYFCYSTDIFHLNQGDESLGTTGSDENTMQITDSRKAENNTEDAENQKNIEDNDTEETEYDVTEGGIHKYRYVIDDCTWFEAFERAKQAGGYLVRINSREEYDYIINEIEQQGNENKQWRIGGRRDLNSNNYYWVDENNETYGEPINSATYWNSSEWLTGEPSYHSDGVDEVCVEIFYSSSVGRWVWNDDPDDIISVVPDYSGKMGYIIEFED